MDKRVECLDDRRLLIVGAGHGWQQTEIQGEYDLALSWKLDAISSDAAADQLVADSVEVALRKETGLILKKTEGSLNSPLPAEAADIVLDLSRSHAAGGPELPQCDSGWSRS